MNSACFQKIVAAAPHRSDAKWNAATASCSVCSNALLVSLLFYSGSSPALLRSCWTWVERVFLRAFQIWQQQLGHAHVRSDVPPSEPGQWWRGGEGSHPSPEGENVVAPHGALQPAIILPQLRPPWWNAVHFAGPPGWADPGLPVRGGKAGMVRRFYPVSSYKMVLD